MESNNWWIMVLDKLIRYWGGSGYRGDQKGGGDYKGRKRFWFQDGTIRRMWKIKNQRIHFLTDLSWWRRAKTGWAIPDSIIFLNSSRRIKKIKLKGQLKVNKMSLKVMRKLYSKRMLVHNLRRRTSLTAVSRYCRHIFQSLRRASRPKYWFLEQPLNRNLVCGAERGIRYCWYRQGRIDSQDITVS